MPQPEDKINKFNAPSRSIKQPWMKVLNTEFMIIRTRCQVEFLTKAYTNNYLSTQVGLLLGL